MCFCAVLHSNLSTGTTLIFNASLLLPPSNRILSGTVSLGTTTFAKLSSKVLRKEGKVSTGRSFLRSGQPLRTSCWSMMVWWRGMWLINNLLHVSVYGRYKQVQCLIRWLQLLCYANCRMLNCRSPWSMPFFLWFQIYQWRVHNTPREIVVVLKIYQILNSCPFLSCSCS